MEGEGGGGMGCDVEREEEEEVTNPLRDRFRVCTISIAESQAKQNNMEISQPLMVCVADMAFKYADEDYFLRIVKSMIHEQLAKDLELFAQHAGRKSVNMEDVILSAHRNNHLAASLRCFCDGIKGKEPQSERKRKKGSRKGDKAAASFLHIAT